MLTFHKKFTKSLFFLSWLLLFSSIAVAKGEIVLDVPKQEIKRSKKERFSYWVHNRHNTKNVGEDDPHLPTFLKYRPSLIPLPFGYQMPRDFVVKNGQLDMRSFSNAVLSRLSSSDLRTLLEYLATVPVEIKWSDSEGHTQSGSDRKFRAHHMSHWQESNAAGALALSMAIRGHDELFVSMLALAPEAILSTFHDHLFALINPEITAHVIGKMLSDIPVGETGVASKVSRRISDLIEAGLFYWVGKDIERLNSYLVALMEITGKIAEKEPSPHKEKALGILLGSVLSGTFKHTDTIKKIDERRIWIVGVVSNFAWAATSFIGCAPMAAPAAAATMGGISVGVVLASSIYTALDFPRDFSSSIKAIEGELEMATLEASLLQGLEEKLNSLLLLKWMQASMHVNGLFD